MSRFIKELRYYCSIIKSQKSIYRDCCEKVQPINFKQLKHPTKIPAQSIISDFGEKQAQESIPEIDSKTIQLLERLSLVDLSDKEALDTLKSSIQFANKIAHIDTSGIEPLYTVLESQPLRLREDRVTEGNCREDILRNAKVTDEDYFVSPPGNIPLEVEEKKHLNDS